MYHSVMDDPLQAASTLGGIVHSTKVFREQMELIARDYNTLTLADVLLFVQGEKEPPTRSVAITFDDGYADNFEVAMPVLDQTGVPAAFYVVVDCVENARLPWPARLRYAFYKEEHLGGIEWNSLAVEEFRAAGRRLSEGLR